LSTIILDSNVLLWWMAGEERLLRTGWIERIDTQPGMSLSVVSPWELWVKVGTGKLVLPPAFDRVLAEARFDLLPISVADGRRAGLLPLLHKDPFDRMIIAQALNRDATVVTGDKDFAQYGVRTILV
jgi:PIN domain nuclease of toxin-antitoxin system